MTAQSPPMGNVWPEVLAWIRGRPLVTHYAPFDAHEHGWLLLGVESERPMRDSGFAGARRPERS